MLKTPRHKIRPLRDRRDSETLAAEAEERGEVRAGTGADRKLIKYKALQLQQIGRNLDSVPLPAENTVALWLSQKDVNTFTLLLWLIQQTGPLDELFVTTFNINQNIIGGFADLLDTNQCQKLSIVISQSIESRMPKRIAELRQVWEARQDRMRVSLCWNHSKVALASNSKGKYVLTGSGNYSFNAEIEQYEMWNSAEAHDWFRKTLEARCFSDYRDKASHKVWGVDG